MSGSKKERAKHSSAAGGQSSSSSASTAHQSKLDPLPEGIVDNTISSYLSPKERHKLAVASPGLFRPGVYLTELLFAVAIGDPGAVVHMIRRTSPDKLFEKSDVTDACGQIFHDVSPLQLMLFLFDWDMLNQIKPLISADNREIAHQQCLEMQGGGADLVKMSQDPRTVPFIELTRYIEDGETYSLLENKDGIIFWNNQFFYANQETQTVTLITAVVPEDEQRLLNALRTSLNDMEINSSRRTSTVEHEFFARTMGHRLERHGIHYERNGVHYQDVRDGVALINAYRKYIRIYDAHQDGTPWNNVEQAWIEVVGLAQRVLPIHILQRFCEENKSFYPLRTVHDLRVAPFGRTLQIHNWVTNRRECLLPLHANAGIGFSFSMYRGCELRGAVGGAGASGYRLRALGDLAAVRRIEEVGKANVAEFIRELDPTHSASSGRRSGPGGVVS